MSLRFHADLAKGVLHAFALEPPWIIQNPPLLPQDHWSYLCQNCRRYDFSWLLSYDLDGAYARLREENGRRQRAAYTKFVVDVGQAKATNDEETPRNDIDLSKYKVVTTEGVKEMFNKMQDQLDDLYCGDGRGRVARSVPTPGYTVWSHGHALGMNLSFTDPHEGVSSEDARRMLVEGLDEGGYLSKRGRWSMLDRIGSAPDMEDILLDTDRGGAEDGMDRSDKEARPGGYD